MNLRLQSCIYFLIVLMKSNMALDHQRMPLHGPLCICGKVINGAIQVNMPLNAYFRESKMLHHCPS